MFNRRVAAPPGFKLANKQTNHPLQPVIKLGFRNPRKKEKDTEACLLKLISMSMHTSPHWQTFWNIWIRSIFQSESTVADPRKLNIKSFSRPGLQGKKRGKKNLIFCNNTTNPCKLRLTARAHGDCRAGAKAPSAYRAPGWLRSVTVTVSSVLRG